MIRSCSVSRAAGCTTPPTRQVEGTILRALSATDRIQPPEKADTIEELAEKLGLDPKELKSTIDGFNAAVNDKDFDLMKLDGKATTGLKPNKTNWAAPIVKAPFYGYPMTSHLTFT